MKSIYFGNNAQLFSIIKSHSDLKSVISKAPNENMYWIGDLKKKCDETNTRFNFPDKIKSNKDFKNFLKSLEPDILICCGYHLKIPQTILDIPKIAAINIHPALLPEYRGQHVIQWALINGEKYTGVTLHHMTEGIDEGDIIFRKEVMIADNDTALTLHKKIHDEGALLLEEILSKLNQGEKLPRSTQDSANARYFRARKPEDGKIDWSQSPQAIRNLIRALVYPWPGAYTEYKGMKLIIDDFVCELGGHGIIAGEIKMQSDCKTLQIFGKDCTYLVPFDKIRNNPF